MRASRVLYAGLLLTAPLAGQATGQSSAPDTTALPDTAPLSLVREVFTFQGGGRDPFMSLLKSGDVRPLITDLKLVTVVYDERYNARSVAVLRDVTTGKRYRAKTGDVIGRLRVTQIRPREVVFTVQEFGFERQQTLSLARQEETP
ncbi:MAG: hypothetical protein ACREMF_03600 [Gemmatimonadales bacterium]